METIIISLKNDRYEKNISIEAIKRYPGSLFDIMLRNNSNFVVKSTKETIDAICEFYENGIWKLNPYLKNSVQLKFEDSEGFFAVVDYLGLTSDYDDSNSDIDEYCWPYNSLDEKMEDEREIEQNEMMRSEREYFEFDFEF